VSPAVAPIRVERVLGYLGGYRNPNRIPPWVSSDFGATRVSCTADDAVAQFEVVEVGVQRTAESEVVRDRSHQEERAQSLVSRRVSLRHAHSGWVSALARFLAAHPRASGTGSRSVLREPRLKTLMPAGGPAGATSWRSAVRVPLGRQLLRMHRLGRFREPPMFHARVDELLALDLAEECESDGRVHSMEVVARVLDVAEERPRMELQSDLHGCDPADSGPYWLSEADRAAGDVPEARTRPRCPLRKEDAKRTLYDDLHGESWNLGIDLLELRMGQFTPWIR